MEVFAPSVEVGVGGEVVVLVCTLSGSLLTGASGFFGDGFLVVVGTEAGGVGGGDGVERFGFGCG